MSDLRKAAEMALEALEAKDGWGSSIRESKEKAKQALRTALAQPVQEPVSGKGKEFSEQLKLCARNVAFAASGHVDMSSAAMQEMFALIDHVCTTIDSPPALAQPEQDYEVTHNDDGTFSVSLPEGDELRIVPPKQPEQEPDMKKLKVTLVDRPVDVELAQYKRMFEAACSALGAIGDALGVDPEEGGAEPILAAIEEIKTAQSKQKPAVYKCPRCATSMDVDLNAKPVDTVNTSQERETEKREQEPVAWRAYTITNGYTLHFNYAEARRLSSDIEPLYVSPPSIEAAVVDAFLARGKK